MKLQPTRDPKIERARRDVRLCVENPQLTLDELDRVECEESLYAFIKRMWHVLEPDQPFVDGWALRAVCEHLEAVTRGDIKKLLINIPPGCAKSLTVSVFWPAWEWGPKGMASTRFILSSYAQQLSERDNMRCRRVIQSHDYQRLWGSSFKLLGDQNAKEKYETDKMGFRIATSVDGVATGERGHRFIIDDAHNVKEAESDLKRENVLKYASEVVPSRFIPSKRKALVIVGQRVHERDISGHLLEKELGFVHVCLPMRFEADEPNRTKTILDFHDPRKEEGELLWPELMPAEEVERMEKDLSSWGGDYAVAGQFQQRPVPRGGGMMKEKDFIVVEEKPEGSVAVRGWDLAASKGTQAAWTCGVLLRRLDDGRILVEHVERFQGLPYEVERVLKATAEADGPDVEISLPQDPGQAGKHQKSSYALLLEGLNVHFSTESGSKEARARPFAAQVAAGNVLLLQAGWVDAYKRECAMFPAGAKKDQVDATSRAYARLLQLDNATQMVAGPRVFEHGE